MTELQAGVRRGRRLDSTDVFCILLIVAVITKFAFGHELARPAFQAWATVFVAICVQASPFVALGVAVSTVIAVYVPPAFFTTVLPKRPAIAVPVAGLAGGILPGCECGSVPVAASLARRGVRPGPAIAFLLAAPAINPVVLVATAVAFPGHPAVVLGRFVASLATAMTMGWLWTATGRALPVRNRRTHEHGSGTRNQRAIAAAGHDLAQTFGLLAIGAASAATLKVVIGDNLLTHISSNPMSSVLAMAALAVVLAVCSESDAFIAASLSQFSLTARLAFMVVGPAVDLKLLALQIGTFGRRFASLFAPLTWLAAVAAASATGALLL
ncbi:MAG TPA: permease [Jatrophihabitans sp.]